MRTKTKEELQQQVDQLHAEQRKLRQALELSMTRKYRDGYHAQMGLDDAHVDAIEASSMFFENGVRFPDNLRHYAKVTA